jgi:hypothetical protein
MLDNAVACHLSQGKSWRTLPKSRLNNRGRDFEVNNVI